jgi:hypothetical protein
LFSFSLFAFVSNSGVLSVLVTNKQTNNSLQEVKNNRLFGNKREARKQGQRDKTPRTNKFLNSQICVKSHKNREKRVFVWFHHIQKFAFILPIN